MTAIKEQIKKLLSENSTEAFSQESLLFLTAWSRAIRALPAEELRPDLMTFAFWIRESNIRRMKESYEAGLQGKGIALHFVPNNIPSLFAYSLTSSILAGNPVIMRLPQKSEPGMQALLKTMEQAKLEVPSFQKRIVMVSYGHEKEVTDYLSANSQVRIVWGGDHTLAQITRSPLKAGGVDILFPDRKSLAVISAKEFLMDWQDEDKREVILRDFYNDTYLTDQNACSSPSFVYWLGAKETVDQAKEVFWKGLNEYVKKSYILMDQLAISKLEKACLLAARFPGCHMVQCQGENYLVRVEVEAPTEAIWECTNPGGFFIEASGQNLEGLLPVVTEKCQTAAVYGIPEEELKNTLGTQGAKGIYRIVPFGHCLEFSLNWDGQDLLRLQCN